jgi:hypothetical protein
LEEKQIIDRTMRRPCELTRQQLSLLVLTQRNCFIRLELRQRNNIKMFHSRVGSRVVLPEKRLDFGVAATEAQISNTFLERKRVLLISYASSKSQSKSFQVILVTER